MTEFPETFRKKMSMFQESLSELETSLKPFLATPMTELQEKVTDPLESAKLDLTTAYATNSMFWAFLVTRGIDPKTHPIKDELLRIKKCMARVKEIEEKKKMMRVDTKAAKRFIKSALWQPTDSPAADSPDDRPTKKQKRTDEKSQDEEEENNSTTKKPKKKKKKKNKN